MKLSFKFTVKQVTEILILSLIIGGAVALMAFNGADFS